MEGGEGEEGGRVGEREEKEVVGFADGARPVIFVLLFFLFCEELEKEYSKYSHFTSKMRVESI